MCKGEWDIVWVSVCVSVSLAVSGCVSVCLCVCVRGGWFARREVVSWMCLYKVGVCGVYYFRLYLSVSLSAYKEWVRVWLSVGVSLWEGINVQVFLLNLNNQIRIWWASVYKAEQAEDRNNNTRNMTHEFSGKLIPHPFTHSYYIILCVSIIPCVCQSPSEWVYFIVCCLSVWVSCGCMCVLLCFYVLSI